MSFPRYAKYKETGIAWLPEVPEGWATGPLTRFTDRITDGAHISPETDGGVHPFVSTKDVVGEHIDIEGCLRTSPETYDYMVRTGCRPAAGDVLYSKDGTIGRTAIVPADLDFVVASSLIILRPALSRLVPQFLNRLLQSAFVASQVDRFVRGAGLPRLSVSNLMRVLACVPPPHEQTAIAAFLEPETDKIDALVATQLRLIDLLNEKRQAVISHAVTQGLDRGVAMKESGADWVGPVPAHWECVRNKSVFHEVDERSDDATGELLTVSHITGVTRRSEKDVNMFMAETLEGYKKCAPGDLVINTMWAWMGALGCSPLGGLVSPSYNVYRRKEPRRLLPGYYDYLCRLPPHAVAMRSRSTGVWESRLRLYPDAFLNMRMPLPPRAEQERIVAYLDEHRRRWDRLVAEAVRAIDLLQERRAALISAAVTGQIDVRDAAARSAA